MKLLVYIVTLLLLVTTFSCGGGTSSSPASADPELKNLGVTFDNYDAGTGKAGDFNFPVLSAADSKPFYVFGSPLPGGALNPTFEYLTDPDAVIFSPVDGTISEINHRVTQDDYSVVITPINAVDLRVVLDHVLNVAVSVGDLVIAGEQLGTAGFWTIDMGRTELQIYNETDGLSYCPFAVFDADLTATFQDKVTNLMDQWEVYVDDPDVYDQDAMVYPGCLIESTPG